jgi:hypothetical protein
LAVGEVLKGENNWEMLPELAERSRARGGGSLARKKTKGWEQKKGEFYFFVFQLKI